MVWNIFKHRNYKSFINDVNKYLTELNSISIKLDNKLKWESKLHIYIFRIQNDN